jgi:16S rRNA processing protein RimM
MNKKIIIAKINSAHGIQGLVNVSVFSNQPKNLEKYQLFDKNNSPVSLKIITVKNDQKKSSFNSAISVIAKIDGVNDRNQAEAICNQELMVERNQFSKTKKNEYYINDLIGLKVINQSQKTIGFVSNVFDFNATAIIEITFDQIAQNTQIEDSISPNIIDNDNNFKNLKINDSTKKNNQPKTNLKIESFAFKNEFFPEVNIDQQYIVFIAPELS